MKRQPGYEGLIMDIGVSEGNDSAFYLAKGFQVLAVEADPNMCKALRTRFDRAIEDGALQLLNFAAGARLGETIEFFVHTEAQGISAFYKRPEVDPAGYQSNFIPTIDWNTLLAQSWLPRYLKLDIELMEEQFLSGMLGHQDVPEFISTECHRFRPCEMLFELGYRRFKIVDQNPSGGFTLPSRQMEGVHVASANFQHASGPFGLDLFGDGEWLDFDALRSAWAIAETRMDRTWFDCHAWKPN